MSARTHEKAGALLVAVVMIGSVLAVGGVVVAQTAGNDAQMTVGNTTTQDVSYLRVAHASPDAPAVDVQFDNETVLSDVEYGSVSDYLTIEPGDHNVTITAANESDEVVFEGEVVFQRRAALTLAASGEVTENASTDFEPVIFNDNAYEPTENESAVRVVHLSPDAPDVDVTTANGSVVLADNVSFGNVSDYSAVPAGNYSVAIREPTPTNDGPVVTTVDVSLANETAYSAMALGYLNPEDAPADTPFEVNATEDATVTVQLPSDEPANETETPTETETPMETDTPTETETMTETPMETATPTETEMMTETPMETDTPTETETMTDTDAATTNGNETTDDTMTDDGTATDEEETGVTETTDGELPEEFEE